MSTTHGTGPSVPEYADYTFTENERLERWFDQVARWADFDQWDGMEENSNLVACPACAAPMTTSCLPSTHGTHDERHLLRAVVSALMLGMSWPAEYDEKALIEALALIHRLLLIPQLQLWPEEDLEVMVADRKLRLQDPLSRLAAADKAANKATEARRRAIIDAAKAGEPLSDIARLLGVTYEGVRKIVRPTGH